MQFVATTTRGAEQVLAEELEALDLGPVTLERGAVTFKGGIRRGYRACLWSRVASRVLVVLDTVPAFSADALYEGLRTIPWNDHVSPRNTLAVDFVGTSGAIRNSFFGALKVKDAIVDSVRDRTGERPSIDLDEPDLRIQCRLHNNQATVSVDLSGVPLHIRGLERDGGPAPLKENLAAAVLRMAGWPAVAAAGGGLVDPMCGSGTFLTEAAAMAANHAPGLDRDRWGFEGWLGHEADGWKAEHTRATEAEPGPIPLLLGIDRERVQVDRARDNLHRAGFPDVEVRLGVMEAASAPDCPPGLVVTNPPYGERLEDEELATDAMRSLGNVLRRRFPGWTGWILAGSPKLARQTGLKPKQKIPLWNGRIECRLVEIPIRERPPERLQ